MQHIQDCAARPSIGEGIHCLAMVRWWPGALLISSGQSVQRVTWGGAGHGGDISAVQGQLRDVQGIHGSRLGGSHSVY